MRQILNRAWQVCEGRSPLKRFLSIFVATIVVLGSLYALPADQGSSLWNPISDRFGGDEISSDRAANSPFRLRSASAQRLRASDIADVIYGQYPDLPLENDYVDSETGDIDTDNTLVSRFIRYHLYVVRRLPTFRLDWKLTFADYLGANQWILEEDYPGAVNLRTNPRDQDIAIIRQLDRAKRDALVETLVEIFSTEGVRLPGFGF